MIDPDATTVSTATPHARGGRCPGTAALQAPRLETERLILRGHTAGDLDDVAAMWAEPDVVRHMSGRVATREQSWTRMAAYAGHWRLLGFGYWAIADKGSGRYLGDVGLADFRRQVTPSLSGLPEAGVALLPDAHGRGLAVEALRRVLQWADAELQRATVCLVSPGHRSALRLAEQCGYTRWHQAAYQANPVLCGRRDSGQQQI